MKSIYDRIDNSIGEKPGYEDEIFYEKQGFRITCNINTTLPYIPYFKVYFGNNEDWIYREKSQDKMCRISLLEPKYLGLKGEDLILNDEQKIRLIEILNSPNIDSPEISNWRALLERYNFLHKEFDLDELIYNPIYKAPKFNAIDENLTIPDYAQLPMR